MSRGEPVDIPFGPKLFSTDVSDVHFRCDPSVPDSRQ